MPTPELIVTPMVKARPLNATSVDVSIAGSARPVTCCTLAPSNQEGKLVTAHASRRVPAPGAAHDVLGGNRNHLVFAAVAEPVVDRPSWSCRGSRSFSLVTSTRTPCQVA
jgi:hypothetical protein